MKKDLAIRLLLELMKNSRRSDRELAKSLGVSQPTVTRVRKKLEKNAIVEYTLIPSFEELNFEIIAFTFISSITANKELIEKAKEWTHKHPNVVYASTGLGMGMDGVIVSLHKNYTEYSKFMSELRTEWAGHLKDAENFIIPLKREMDIKPFSLKYLEKA